MGEGLFVETGVVGVVCEASGIERVRGRHSAAASWRPYEIGGLMRGGYATAGQELFKPDDGGGIF
jgi:hypothetical protein